MGIAGAGIILILFGAIAVLLSKKPAKKSKAKRQKREKLDQENHSTEKSEYGVDFVSSWEELPAGDWLPNDENGVNWYLDNQGRHWYSDAGGFRIWKD